MWKLLRAFCRSQLAEETKARIGTEPSLVDQRRSVDLLNRPDVTSHLLLESARWRSRVVEEVRLESAVSARTSRSLQVVPLREVLQEIPSLELDRSTARLALPLATLPKGPLVNLHLKAGEETPLLLMRYAIAEREAEYVKVLGANIGVPVDAELMEFLVEICGFTPGPWVGFRRSEHLLGARERALKKFLISGIGGNISDRFTEWHERAVRIGRVLSTALGEGHDENSSADMPLLAFPGLSSASLHKKRSIEETVVALTASLEKLEQFVAACAAVPNAEPDPLVLLAEYGRRYEAIVSCVVPLDDALEAVIARDLPIKVGFWGRTELDLVFNDAWSNHVAIRAQDHDVEIVRRRPVGPTNARLEKTLFNMVRDSREDLAVYGSDATRDYLVRFRFRFRAPFIIRATGWSFIAVLGAAIFLLVSVRPLNSQDVGLFVVPTTISSGLLLIQQRTSMAIRAQKTIRYAMLAAILSLWTTVIVLYMMDSVETGNPSPEGASAPLQVRERPMPQTPPITTPTPPPSPTPTPTANP